MIPVITREMIYKDLTDKQEEIFDALVNKTDNVKLPEAVFKEHFLPYFTNPALAEDNNKIVAAWVGIAGSPVAEVDVVSNEGTTLFTVPPLMDTTVLNVVRDKREPSFKDVQAGAEMRAAGLPGESEKFFRNHTNAKLNRMIGESDQVPVNSERWNKIFNHYGIKTDNTTATSQSTESDLSDDFEY